MNRTEATITQDDLSALGYDVQIVTFDDGNCGVWVQIKPGECVGIAEVELQEVGLDLVKLVKRLS